MLLNNFSSFNFSGFVIIIFTLLCLIIPSKAQTDCPPGLFGSNCSKICHCPPDDGCYSMNGLCFGGICDVNWGGSACQTRLPKLLSPPRVEMVTIDELVISWRSWNGSVDVGDRNVTSYTIEFCSSNISRSNISDNSSVCDTWQTVISCDGSFNYSATFQLYFCSVPIGDSNMRYIFRVVVAYLDYDKLTRGLPSDPSQPVIPADYPTGSPIWRMSLTSDENTSSIIVTWIPPSVGLSLLLKYIINYQVVGIGNCGLVIEEPMEDEIQASARSYVISFVQNWRKYNVTVAAVYGEATYSLTQSIITQETVPTGVPHEIRASSLFSRNVTIIWSVVDCLQRGGVLLHYAVVVTRITDQSIFGTFSSLNNQIVVSNLTPFEKYGVVISYVNAVGQGPDSVVYIVQTQSEAPPAPQQLQVEEVDQVVRVSWAVPVPAYGILLEYRVIYWKTGNSIVEQYSNSINNSQQLSGLQPFTTYSVQVQARNNVTISDGWGPRSNVVSFTTLDGQPSAPTNLIMSSRTVSCITVTWNAPNVANGMIISYKVTYGLTSAGGVRVSNNVTIDARQFSACSLSPATKYHFEVSACSRTGYGSVASIDVWTEVAIPSVPPPPTIVSVFSYTIRLLLQPISNTQPDPTTSYFIVVSSTAVTRNKKRRFVDSELRQMEGTVRRRQKRSLPDPVSFIPLPGYTAAELPSGTLTGTFQFNVGDGSSYGSYKNVQLSPNKYYIIFFVVASSLDGVTKMSFSQTIYSVQTLPAPLTNATELPTSIIQTTLSDSSQSSADVGSSKSNAVAIGVSLGVIFFLIICVIVAILVWKLGRKNGKEMPLFTLRDRTPMSLVNLYQNQLFENFKEPDLENKSDSGINFSSVSEEGFRGNDIVVANIRSHKRKHLEHEFQRLPSGYGLNSTIGQLSANRNCNFSGVIAFDQNRVEINSEGLSDYYNANYIPDYRNQGQAYIAAEIPFNEITLRKFWIMIGQEKVNQVVIIGSQTDATSEFWLGSQSKKSSFGNWSVQLLHSSTFCNFLAITFELENVDLLQKCRVKLYKLTNWSEDLNEVPDCPIALLEFRTKIASSSLHQNSKGPLLVLCKNGASNTGIFIALDSLLNQAKVENSVNMFRVCSNLRQHRPMTIQTFKQYNFVWTCLLEALGTNYTIIGKELKIIYRLMSEENVLTKKSYFSEQFEQLMERKISRSSINSQTSSNDIELVKLDSYRQANMFVVTKLVGLDEIENVLKIVVKNQVHCIVIFDEHNLQSFSDWTPNKTEKTRKFGKFTVEVVDSKKKSNFVSKILKVFYKSNKQETFLLIKLFHFTDCSEGLPLSREHFIDLMMSVHNWLQETGVPSASVLVQCNDGNTYSGLFCACFVVCEKMTLEGHVGIYHTIKSMRNRMPQIVNTLEQYKFCFKILWDYMRTAKDRKRSHHREQ